MQPTILVSIASYNDPELPRTLDNCLASARFPDALRFGICWQYDADIPIDLRRFKADRRFRFSEHGVRESQGGSWARNIAQQLYDGETYLLQIDSHMMFAPGWDHSLVQMMRRMPADKPLISMIAPLFHIHEQNGIHRATDMGICVSRVDSWDQNSGWAPWFVWGEKSSRRDTRNRFLSGQFVFTLGDWADEVRQDPDHYYWGEEFALSVRSYTHGYDFFVPDSIVAWHMLHLDGPPRRHWEHGDAVVKAKNKVAIDRLAKLVYSDKAADQKALGRYGLGSKRTIAEFERFAGMDLQRKCAHPDVFAGRAPDPMTIKSDDDWAKCVSCRDYQAVVAA